MATDVSPTPSSQPEKELAQVPGAEPSARLDPWWWLVALVALVIILLITFEPDPYRRILLFVSEGIYRTIYVTLISFVLMLGVGMIGGLGRMSKNRIIYGIASLYVELIRGIPVLVQLMWWYFAFPVVIQGFGRTINNQALIGYQANGLVMAILGLVVCYGAYMSEIYRAGIQSIPKGQMEAARSLGMNYFQAMRFVIMPQAIRVILPPVGNEFIALLKDSSLISVVAVPELSRRAREFMSTTFTPIETWNFTALLYLMMTLFSARVATWIERRTRFER